MKKASKKKGAGGKRVTRADRTIRVLVTLEIAEGELKPGVVSHYIRTAIGNWGGGLPPDDPMHSENIRRVAVSTRI